MSLLEKFLTFEKKNKPQTWSVFQNYLPIELYHVKKETLQASTADLFGLTKQFLSSLNEEEQKNKAKFISDLRNALHKRYEEYLLQNLSMPMSSDSLIFLVAGNTKIIFNVKDSNRNFYFDYHPLTYYTTLSSKQVSDPDGAVSYDKKLSRALFYDFYIMSKSYETNDHINNDALTYKATQNHAKTKKGQYTVEFSKAYNHPIALLEIYAKQANEKLTAFGKLDKSLAALLPKKK